MADAADILGRDRPVRQLPPWSRPVAIILAVGVAAGWFVVTQLSHGSAPAPAPTPSTDSVDDALGRICAAANTDGLAWGAPIGSTQPANDRLVIWRVHLCNIGRQSITVESLRPLSDAERNLPTVHELQRANVSIDGSNFDPLPVRIPAGGRADVMTVSAILGCQRSSADSGLSASVRVGDSTKRVDMPVRRPAVVPVELWCNQRRGIAGGDPALPLLRDGPLTVAARAGRIDIGFPVLNPNGVPITVTGAFPPSPGVRVVRTQALTVPAGGRAVTTVQLAVDNCADVFVDAPWQVTFMGRVDGESALLTPVRLAGSDWQAAALRRICPAARSLATSTEPGELKVSGPFARGARASYLVTQVVRNVSDRVLVLRLHPRSAPGMLFRGVNVIPGAAAHQGVGDATGSPLREWAMTPGSTAFLTYFYRLGDDTDAQCLGPPVDRWRAPVDAADQAGRPVTVADEATQAPQVPQAWVGGWQVTAAEGCPRTTRVGRSAPFLVFSSQVGAVPDTAHTTYLLDVYGLPGESPATLIGARLVGAFAGLSVLTDPALGPAPAQKLRQYAVTIPVHCPPPGVPVTLALSYSLKAQSQSQAVIVELGATPVSTGQRC